MKNWLRISGIVAIVIFIAIGLFVWQKSAHKKPQVETLQIKPGTLVLDIAFSGSVQPRNTAQLGFESSGIVKKVLVTIGDKVRTGEHLASLDTSLQQLNLLGVTANQSNLQAQAQIAVSNSSTALQKLQEENKKTITALRQNVIDAKKALDQNTAVWIKSQEEADNSTTSTTEVKRLAVITAQGLYNSAQQALATGKATAAKTEAAAQSVLQADQARFVATKQASLTNSGEALLETQTQSARVQLSKQVLIAPFDGVVTDILVEPGELTTGGQSVVIVKTIEDVEIVAQVSEKQVAKLSTGMNADITFDALGIQPRVSTKITHIDPTGTLVDGLPKYNIYLSLPNDAPSLKPDFTANIIIHAAQKDNVLTLPRSAIVTEDGAQHVYIQAPESYLKRNIATGTEGSDGNIEIISGVSEGDVVVARPSELSTAVTTPSSGN